jgi:hypothetical protein
MNAGINPTFDTEDRVLHKIYAPAQQDWLINVIKLAAHKCERQNASKILSVIHDGKQGNRKRQRSASGYCSPIDFLDHWSRTKKHAP